ncbi:C40 family peptidase [Piscicoccus intestinalis]|uniref:C40 family peptidase n=1 Tax=Piscicoccus intestinalis TaxID=746033 RepID=UPI00083822B7|nr:C40 family peptidase [Piscicoccus intestinalis]
MNMMTAAPARLLATGLLSFGLTGGIAAVSAPAAQAAPAVQSTALVASYSTVSASVASSAVRVAASKKGKPYRWGASGPNAFDCSGLTSYAYRQAGKSLPRTAHAQYRASKKISRSQARPGDLVFYGGARKHHVGIYAGNGKMWHAPNSGSSVKLSSVRSGASFGRV